VFEDAASDHYEVKFDECLAVSTAHHNHLPLPAIKEKFQHFILLTIKNMVSKKIYRDKHSCGAYLVLLTMKRIFDKQ
jgi:hypothetical protein